MTRWIDALRPGTEVPSAAAQSSGAAAGFAGRRRFAVQLACAALGLPCHPARAITGRWAGRVQDQDGAWSDVAYRMSERGFLILNQLARGGAHVAELTRVGQTERWLLRGSGYGTCSVQALEMSASRLQMVTFMTFESGSAATTMSQERAVVVMAFQQEGERLRVEATHESVTTHTSSLTGVREQRVAEQLRGVLQRA